MASSMMHLAVVQGNEKKSEFQNAERLESGRNPSGCGS